MIIKTLRVFMLIKSICKPLFVLPILFFILGALSEKLVPIIKGHYYNLANKWDLVSNPEWTSSFQIVQITSSNDQAKQKAYFLPTNKKKPLLVSLHNWSGNFSQKDPLAILALEHHWNYISPDFRGANNNKDSCLSPLVLTDVDDAIQYALDNSNVDLKNIFIVGASGGGYVTLGSYLRTKHKVKRFISWVPISDLSAWYHQSLAIGNKRFADDIIACTSSNLNKINEKELRKRSPLYWKVPLNTNGGLDIYAGINDGHTKGGSVPISHSLLFYNHLLSAWELDEKHIDPQTLSKLLTRAYPRSPNNERMQNREIIYQIKASRGTLTIFDGGHEILSEYTFNKLLELSQ